MALRRRTIAVLTIAATGAAGLGVGAVAFGATTTVAYRDAVSCQVTEPVAVPDVRYDTEKFFVAAGATKTGTVAVPTTVAALPGVTVTGWHLVFGSLGTSGGSAAGEVFALVGGAQARQPIGQQLPGSQNEAWTAASATPLNYSFFDHSKTTQAQITLAAYVSSATHTVTRVYAGTVCPTGTTAVATISPATSADPTPVVTPSP